MIEQKQIFKHRNKLSDELYLLFIDVPEIWQLKIPINARH